MLPSMPCQCEHPCYDKAWNLVFEIYDHGFVAPHLRDFSLIHIIRLIRVK